MAEVTAKVYEITRDFRRIVDDVHPPVIITGVVTQGNGVVPEGTLVAFDTQYGKFKPYDGTNVTEVDGVVLKEVDTESGDGVTLVLLHGVVNPSYLKKKGESGYVDIEEAERMKLAQKGIYTREEVK